MDRHDNFIGGEFVPARDYRMNTNPSDAEDRIGEYAQAAASDVDAAIEAAHRALPGWASAPLVQRSQALQRIGAGITAREAELADMLAREEGKTLVEALGEVRRAAATFGYYAGQILNPVGEVYGGLNAGMAIETMRRPVGVVGIIAPWNFPIAIPAWKTAPALAFGNTVVLKPADLVPGTAWLLSEIISEAGLSDGVFNLVMGRGSVVGQRIAESPLVRAVSFTGSTAVGRGVAATAVANGLKRVQLEMGGKNPLVVMDDADLDVAVAAALDGAFGSTGQRCTASSRLVVHAGVHDRFVEMLRDGMSRIRPGDARDPHTTMGPVVSEAQLQTDLDYIAIGSAEGATLVQGGERIDTGRRGNFLTPALFVDATPDMRISQEEIFGPVAAVIKVSDYEEALAVANGVEYGLSSGICTTSLARARDFAARSRSGIITINKSTASTDFHVPFGGTKASSYGGREQGTAAREFFTELSTVYTVAGDA
ncbi:aldehyde dehydrogenase family protein [Microbacterium aurantiacum]|uniref:Aldehyde dehydrogenase n=1 Tax=Microbacterium aurantiacum TaxID=162393 RepID=A0A0M9VMJ1_9MICO|nr:aldehyde dehydrogenase family protein [Microbacterium chocolatum]ANG84846.1 aldehyde dehydrogenase [Microbacterium chocolatum]KOS12055.1 aldehyde dehydrogenase [Microbacterium chocolatum]